MFPDKPVVLRRIDGHAYLVNDSALKLAGINNLTKVEGGEISTVSNIYNKLTNDKKFSKNQIDKSIVKLKKDKKTVNQYLKKIKPYLNSGHRELIIKAMYLVASSDGHLDKKEGELLMKTANVLEMTSAHVKGVLSELDKKNNN